MCSFCIVISLYAFHFDLSIINYQDRNSPIQPPIDVRFLSLVIKCRNSAAYHNQPEWVTFSLCHDSCRDVTQCAMEASEPHPVALHDSSIPLSKKTAIDTLLNRLGHCENYLFPWSWKKQLTLQSRTYINN